LRAHIFLGTRQRGDAATFSIQVGQVLVHVQVGLVVELHSQAE
jgi:hypothetical protein